MPPGMPYHLEKGPLQRILEGYMNTDRKTMRKRIEKLRRSKNSIKWLTEGILGSLTSQTQSGAPPNWKQELIDHLMGDWFGCVPTSTGWQRQDMAKDPRQPELSKTTGYWVAYRGNVAEIMRQALLWAMELSLGLSPGEDGRGRWWPFKIEIFWKCPTPWYEMWVVRRPLHVPPLRRGIITVIMMTPAQLGANVAERPIAEHPKTKPYGLQTPHAVPSWQDDYERLGEVWPANRQPTGRPRVKAVDRQYAMWVVTHANHVKTGTLQVTDDTRGPADFWDWGIPQLRIYRGVDDVVIVSPSMPAGGVTHDGRV